MIVFPLVGSILSQQPLIVNGLFEIFSKAISYTLKLTLTPHPHAD